MKLYEISEQMKALELFLEENEASAEAIKDTLEELEGAFEDKAEGVIQILKGYEAEAKALKEEAKRLKERSDRAAKKMDGLKGYLEEQMKATGKEKLQAGIFKVGFRKNPPSIDIIDLKLVPKAYKKTKIEVVPDKNTIKKAFQDGEEVPGAIYIDDKYTLRIE